MAAGEVAGCSVIPSNKGGYDYEFVSPPPKSLECPICLLTLHDPHVISCCGNEFCQRCIERVQRDGKPCPLCNEHNFSTMLHKKLVREVNALVVRCPQNKQGCEWEGELGQLQGHLNPDVGKEGCGYVIVACPYKCGMQLQRRKIHEHEMETCPKRPIEMQVASLMRKFEAIDAENKLLRQEVCAIKEAHEKEIQEIKFTYESEINQLKCQLDEFKSKNSRACDKLIENQETLKFEVKENAETLKTLEEKCVTLQNNKAPLSLPPFYFVISNVDHYLERNLDFVSDPFYSHPGGYKMDITVRSDTDSGARATHLCLYVSIIRGEFDDQLKWPFDGEVTVQVYNRTKERWSEETKIQLNEKECGLDVVERQVGLLSSAGWGCEKFLSYPDLKANFVKDTNVVRFRIMSVKVHNI